MDVRLAIYNCDRFWEHYLQDYEENRASYVRIIIAIQKSDNNKGNYVEGM